MYLSELTTVGDQHILGGGTRAGANGFDGIYHRLAFNDLAEYSVLAIKPTNGLNIIIYKRLIN